MLGIVKLLVSRVDKVLLLKELAVSWRGRQETHTHAGT